MGGREGTARLSWELWKPCPCLVPASRTSVDWLWGALVFHSPSVTPPPMAGAGPRRCPDFPACFQDLAKPGLGEQTPKRLQGYRGGGKAGGAGSGCTGARDWGSSQTPRHGGGAWRGRGLQRAGDRGREALRPCRLFKQGSFQK